MIRRPHLALLAGAVLALPAGAQPQNHIGAPLAEVCVRNGCLLAETDAAKALTAEGFYASDFQTQAIALHNGGYLAKAADGRLQLVNWGDCS